MTNTQIGQSGTESKGLKPGALGLLSSVVVGVASTAPAYSLAASLGFVVVTANGDGIIGTKAPLIMVLAFVPMYFIAVAYAELNKAEPDCGTTFTWAARAFGTRLGWLGGTLHAPGAVSCLWLAGNALPFPHPASTVGLDRQSHADETGITHPARTRGQAQKRKVATSGSA